MKLLSYIKNVAAPFFYYGNNRFCPVCNKSCRRFRHYGLIPRKDAECPHCGSLERDRFFWLYLSEKTSFFDGAPKIMLHVAPEQALELKFRETLGDNYITADLYNPHVMIKMDITDIEYADQSFDIIYCAHVLEHVENDKGAIREFYRVLKDDGWAILLVPITAEKTLEDPSIANPKDRLRAFGQEDHVRRYGPDYVDRLRVAGFNVEIIEVNDLVQSDEAATMGLTSASGEIYFCTKRASAAI